MATNHGVGDSNPINQKILFYIFVYLLEERTSSTKPKSNVYTKLLIQERRIEFGVLNQEYSHQSIGPNIVFYKKHFFHLAFLLSD